VSFFDERAGALPASSGPIPAEWTNALKAARRNAVPIAIRVLGTTPSWPASGPTFLQLSAVDALVFETKEDLDAFRASGFADYDVELINPSLEVDAKVFAGASGSGVGIREARDQHEVDVISETFRCQEALAALHAVLATTGPGRPGWIRALAPASPKRSAPSREEVLIEALVNGVMGDVESGSEEEFDLAALTAASSVLLRRFPVAVGWPASEVLKAIVEEIERISSEEALTEHRTVLDKWSQMSLAVIESREDPPQLLDTKSVPLRAILFLLLRGDIEPILDVTPGEDSTAVLKVGENVRAMAACLAAVRTGLRNLPVSAKVPKDSPNPRHWMEYLGRYLLSGLEGEFPNVPKRDSLTVKYRGMSPLRGEWVLSVKRTEVARKLRRVDPGLSRLEALGEGLDYEVGEHGDTGLMITVRWPDKRAQPVYLAMLKPEGSGGNFVRFSSPAMSLASSRSSGKWPTPKLNKLSKGFLVDLLERNARPDLNCRFTLDRTEQAVTVVVDQLLETLDDEEFRHHVEHVAKVADDYEKEMGRDDFR